MANDTLPFRISTGLKNIIGRDLITDDYVAVFELVKNSFDAYANTVTITFEPDKIVIKDDGKGMNLDDIRGKWLFVAYSAKREGVEDAPLENKGFDRYRDKIQIKRYYAGAKGIGRFSCDRLGNKLVLTTKSASSESAMEEIEVDWSEFDSDSNQEFMNINVQHRTITPFTQEQKTLAHGTILKISGLNSVWTREKKLDLKKSLEKLINPLDKESDEVSREHKFRIIIRDEQEEAADGRAELPRDQVNGEVKNFVFETLRLKTTQILTEIDSDGEGITTSIKDRGTLIYKIKKANSTNPKLKNIRFHLFFLNRTAKTNFTRAMGMQPVTFGSVFVYKNGFRIAPYGDYRDDSFGLDTRKGQKVFQRLGTRDVIGRIEIIGDNPHFREVSSRNGGLVKNDHYQAMFDCFIENCLERLEDYLQRVAWRVSDDKDKTDVSALKGVGSKAAVIGVISDALAGKDTVLEDLDTEFAQVQPEELDQLVEDEVLADLHFIAGKLGNQDYAKAIERTEKENEELRRRISAEEEERKAKDEEVRRLEEELEAERRESLFSKSLVGKDIKEIVSLQHHIDRATDRINRNIDQLIAGINEGIGKQQLLKLVERISLENKKISTVAQFVTNANFNVKANSISKDLNRFIRDYILNVHQEYEHLRLNWQLLKVNVESDKIPFVISFKPIEIIMILDNLFSNSHKADAKNVVVELTTLKTGEFEMTFADNGKGIPDDDLPRIFNLGFTQTDGSGIGLYHVDQIAKKMKAKVRVNNQSPKGVSFSFTFPKHET